MQNQVKFNRDPEKLPEKVWEALVESQVRFRVPEKVPEKVPDGEGCREGLREGFGNLQCRARSGSTGSTGFAAFGFAARFRKICKNKTLRLLGIPRKLIVIDFKYCKVYVL